MGKETKEEPHMKRLVYGLLAVLLLSGCAAKEGKPVENEPYPDVTVVVTDSPSPEALGLWGNPQKNDPAPAEQAMTAPPALYVSVGDATASASTGSYEWFYANADGTGTGVEACGMHPLESTPYFELLPSRGETAVLSFAPGCTLTDVAIRAWDEAYAGDYENDGKAFMPDWIRDGDEITVTLPDFGAIYEVTASFDGAGRGKVTYAFRLTDEKKTATKPFSQEIVRVGWTETGEKPVRLLTDADALSLCLAPHFVPGSGNERLNELLQAYDVAFFAEHDLLALYFSAGSGSARYSVMDIQYDADGVTVAAKCDMPEVGTSDMGAWLLFCAVEKGAIADENAVSVVFPTPGM